MHKVVCTITFKMSEDDFDNANEVVEAYLHHLLDTVCTDNMASGADIEVDYQIHENKELSVD